MIELAIVAGGGAALGITASIAIFVMSRRALEATKGEADWRVKAGNLLAATTSAEQWKAKAQEHEATIKGLTELIQDVAKDLPPDGARARMHAKWWGITTQATATAAAASGELVRSTEPSTTRSDTDLLDPDA